MITPLDVLQEQGKLTVNNIKKFQSELVTDAWEEKLLREDISSRHRLKRVTMSEHNMFRLILN